MIPFLPVSTRNIATRVFTYFSKKDFYFYFVILQFAVIELELELELEIIDFLKKQVFALV